LALAFAAFVTEFEPASVPLIILEVHGAKPALTAIAEEGGSFVAGFVQRRNSLAYGLGSLLGRFPCRLRFHGSTSFGGLYASLGNWEEKKEEAHRVIGPPCEAALKRN